MTRIYHFQLRCPCCQRKFESRAWLSTNTAGGQATDFHIRAVGAQPLPLEIHTCPFCGFSGREDDYQRRMDPALRKKIRERLTPLMTKEEILAERRYEYAAWIAEWSGAPVATIADRYLRAAWCAEDAGNQAAECGYRRQAISHFEEALQKQEVDEKQVAKITYLIGELYRHVGEKDQAREWFDRVPQAAGSSQENRWLIELAEQQKTNPKEYFGNQD